ncbi:aminopeptidase P family protein [Psychrobium sp. 1_MG-2023]|uniref:aminopeptidase P family protein n=1 Tax=Psychrobium sp. 1_MG-2023 TaxID=3062624 RepID=UPI000C3392BC|nr:aminopeptidase P family protein [Psychrobium sp. 1_MG-2023]MDP2561768.1 aminopeptidase P family protein [Psychrobium sp. 1_MG-2023]PKF59747.1 aminopeptidase P family protein [Alteromonadales bacterium alter-6D02]
MTTQSILTRLRQQHLSPHGENHALVIFSDININHISGFTGHAATVLLTGTTNYLLTDYRYFEQAKEQATQYNVICRDRDQQSLGSLLEQLLRQDNCSTLAFEAEHISVGQWHKISADISLSAEMYSPLCGAIEELRYIKSAQQIQSIERAAHIADTALANILPLVQAGITERELCNELEYHMAKLGSEGLSFPTILLFGERSALPHGIPSDRRLTEGDFILIDFGAVVNGYRSDMTRTFVFGKATQQQKRVYQLVSQAQQQALDAVTEGVTGDYLYQQSAYVLSNSEYKDFAGEGLGHGIGLELHEPPFIGPGCQSTIEKGAVITIEPGIYIPNWGGVRIEDDVVLTDKGLKVLTKAPKTLIEL